MRIFRNCFIKINFADSIIFEFELKMFINVLEIEV